MQLHDRIISLRGDCVHAKFFQLYHGENKLNDDDDVRFVLDQHAFL